MIDKVLERHLGSNSWPQYFIEILTLASFLIPLVLISSSEKLDIVLSKRQQKKYYLHGVALSKRSVRGVYSLLSRQTGGGGDLISDLAKTAMVLPLKLTLFLLGSVNYWYFSAVHFQSQGLFRTKGEKSERGLKTKFYRQQEPGLRQNCVCCRIIPPCKYPTDPQPIDGGGGGLRRIFPGIRF